MNESLKETYHAIDKYFEKENIRGLALLAKELAKQNDAFTTVLSTFSEKPEASVERLAVRALDFAQSVLDKLTDGEVIVNEDKD